MRLKKEQDTILLIELIVVKPKNADSRLMQDFAYMTTKAEKFNKPQNFIEIR